MPGLSKWVVMVLLLIFISYFVVIYATKFTESTKE